MRRLLIAIVTILVTVAILWAGGCVKVTRGSQGNTKIRPGTIEVTRHNSPDTDEQRHAYEGEP